MERLNIIGVETVHGLKTIELIRGDVTDIDCDLLGVSAFSGSYVASRGTVLRALLEKHNFSLKEEFERRDFDLRDQFGIWVTRELSALPFARVICVEMIGKTDDPSLAMENLYVGLAILEAKNIRISTLALPLLGTGNQNFDPATVVSPLISYTTEALKRLRQLDRVVFAVLSERTAEIVRDEMDRQLGYARTELPRRELVAALLADIRATVGQIRLRTSGTQLRMADEMLVVVAEDDPPATEIGLLARRLAEVITDSRYDDKPSIDLFTKIEGLGQRGISPWVVSYLHTLRVIGNEVVHIRERSGRIPPNLAAEDVALCLFCILRVARFWLDSVAQDTNSQTSPPLSL